MANAIDATWELIDNLFEIYETGFPIFPGKVVINAKELAYSLESLKNVLDEGMKESRVILQKKEEILQSARNKADRIIASAENERYRLLSESSIMKDIEEKAEEFKRRVIDECEDIKMKAFNEAEDVRLRAQEESIKVREGAQDYANQILSKLEGDLSQLYQVVSNGKQYLNEMKANTENIVSADRR